MRAHIGARWTTRDLGFPGTAREAESFREYARLRSVFRGGYSRACFSAASRGVRTNDVRRMFLGKG